MFDDPLDPFTTPYMAPMPQQETQSRLEMLGDDLLGGLGYFGNVLDKTFGGRAVRGALGGNARELLSILPGSDTLGITNFDDRVSGRQLLGLPESSGEEGFGWDDAKGIGLEIALDPSMWVGAAVPKLVAQGLNAGAKAGGRGIQAVSGINPYTFAQKKVVNEVDRIGGNLFDRSRGGAWQSANQATARGTYFPTLDAATDVARREYLDALTPVDELVKKGFDQDLTMRGAMQAGEGDLPGALSTLQKAGYGPIDAQKVIDSATGYQKLVQSSSQAMETQSGALSNIVEDIPKWKQKLMDDYGPALPAFGPRPAEYVPHRLTSELGGVNYGSGNRSMTAFSEFQAGREEAYKGLGGAVAINDLARQARPPIPMGPPPTQMEIADNVFKSLTDGLPAGWQSQPWAKELTDGAMKQSEDLANRLAFLPPNVAEQGMFHEDLFGNLFSRKMAAARTTASADTIVAGLNPAMNQVKKVVDLQKANVPYVSVNEFLSKEGLTDVAGQKIASALNLPPIANKLKDQLKDYGIPVEVANDMLRIGQSISAPSTLRPIIDAFTNWSHNLKANLTYPFPSFNTRNLLGGLFNQWRDNALVPAAHSAMSNLQRGGSLTDDIAKKLYPGLTTQEATIAVRNELMAAKVSFARNNQAFDVAASDASSAFGGFLPGELPTVGGQAKSYAEAGKEWAGRNLPKKGQRSPFNSETFFLTKGGREVANAGEDFTRGSHYLAKRLQGASAAEAKLATMKYQLDYCVDEETQALTRHGWASIDELQVGDEVLTINPETKQIEWNDVEDVNVFDSPGSLIKWKNTTFDSMTTINHRWLAVGSGYRGGHVSINDRRPTNHFVTTGEIVEGQKYKRLIVGGGLPLEEAACLFYEDELIELIGWYIAEGWDFNTSFGIGIGQSEKHNPTYCERIRSLQKHFSSKGATATECKPKDNGWGVISTWYFGRGIGDVVRKLCPGKQLTTEFITSMTAKQRRLLFDTLMAGDGHIRDGGTRIFTQKDQGRTDGFQYLCCLLGIRSNMRRQSNGIYHVTAYLATELYVHNLPNEVVPYLGRVWCPTTKNKTWMARRNGFTYWTGNSNMSEFEKNVMKRIFPFYSYSRRSLPPLLEDLAKNPAKMSAAFRISSSRPDEGFVPGYLGEGTALSLGKGASGDTRFVSALGLPQEDETIKILGNLMTGDVTRAMQGAAGMISPILKTPLEQASGTQLSTGRKLSDLKQNYAGKAITELGLDEPFPGLPQMVSQYAGGTPAARFLTTAGKITDTRKDVSDKLINLLTGVQLTDVDLERQALIEGRKALTSRLEQSPLAREWSEVYVPKEKLAQMSPRELEDYRFYRALEEQAKRESQQRKFRQILTPFE